MNSLKSLISEYALSDGAVLFSTPLGNILIGCPPEILKLLLIRHLPMPDTVVIPGTLLNHSSSQACLEFPFYHFLFIQQGLAKGKKFKVLAKEDVCQKLAAMLRVTLLGPGLEEAMQVEKKLGLVPKLNKKLMAQIVAETQYLALKNKAGKILQLEDMVEFIPFAVGAKAELYPEMQSEFPVALLRLAEDEFQLLADREITCKLEVKQAQEPVYQISAHKASKAEKTSKTAFTVRCLGTSEGFDPTRPANGFLLHFQGKWMTWDCPAYLRKHLAAVGLKFKDLDGLIISHVHEDHLDIGETIEEGRKVPIFTSPEIFHCMLLKLMAVKNCTYDQAKEHYEFHPLYANQPTDLFGSMIEVFYSLHAIPALGMKLTVQQGTKRYRIFISGDNLPKRRYQELKDAQVLQDFRWEEVQNRLPAEDKFDLVFVDAGSGLIHGDPSDYFDNANQVLYIHTGKPIENLPPHHAQIEPGHFFEILP